MEEDKINNTNLIQKFMNDTNKRLEELEKKYELIKEENMKYKEQIKNNEITIINLNRNLNLVREENLKFLKEFKKLKKEIIDNKENNKIINEENNKIINEENNKIINKENKKTENKENNKIINEENNKIINEENIKKEKKEKSTKTKTDYIFNLENMDQDFFNPKEDNNINKKNKKKDNIKKSKTIKSGKKGGEIVFKGKTLLESLEDIIIKIFTDKSSDIDKDDMNSLKKLFTVLIISNNNPMQNISEFLKNNFNNFQNELDENNRTILANKKGQLYSCIETLSFNIVQAKNGGKEYVDEFIKQFRDKYGITEKDYDDKKLKEQIKKGKKEIDILTIILKHIKYLK